MKRTPSPNLVTDTAKRVEAIVLLDEEHRPLPWDPSPGMLIGRVTEALGHAAHAVSGYYETYVPEEEQEKLMEASACLIHAAAYAINGSPTSIPTRTRSSQLS